MNIFDSGDEDCLVGFFENVLRDIEFDDIKTMMCTIVTFFDEFCYLSDRIDDEKDLKENFKIYFNILIHLFDFILKNKTLIKKILIYELNEVERLKSKKG